MAWMIEKPTTDIQEAIRELRYDPEMDKMREGLAHFAGTMRRAHVEKVAEMARRVHTDPRIAGMTSYQQRYKKIEDLCNEWLQND